MLAAVPECNGASALSFKIGGQRFESWPTYLSVSFSSDHLVRKGPLGRTCISVSSSDGFERL